MIVIYPSSPSVTTNILCRNDAECFKHFCTKLCVKPKSRKIFQELNKNIYTWERTTGWCGERSPARFQHKSCPSK